MKSIRLLDCTLRDGGYCNKWYFENENIKKIINGLEHSNIEIIECGFITNKVEYNENTTRFTKLEQLKDIIKDKKSQTMYVVMMNYGEYEIEKLPSASDSIIDGIRLAFHKKDIDASIETAKAIQKKGYRVFLQPMVSMSYSDEQFLDLINKANQLHPYAFYIVDSFGMMEERDLLRFFFLSDTNLKEQIVLGFHSHNNLQMAYANSRTFVQTESKRNLIVDVSIMGMGRGAGNLNAELMMTYLNSYFNKRYNYKYIISIIDEVLSYFYKRNYWGYSLPNYLSAIRNVHPNYAMYLEAKQTLTLKEMEEILSSIEESKAVNYDKAYIEILYINYLEKGNQTYEKSKKIFERIVKDKTVLLIAPGKSAKINKNDIIEYKKQKDTITISVNFVYPYMTTDYVFVSNKRRFSKLSNIDKKKLIVTSNIDVEDPFLKVGYKQLVLDNEIVKDNSLLMLIKLLIKLNVSNIVLAGLDGYSFNPTEDYIFPEMEVFFDKEDIMNKNVAIENTLNDFRKQVSITFLTKSKYIK